MSARPPFSTLSSRATGKPAAAAPRGSLSWVKSVLGRSMRLEQRRAGEAAVASPPAVLTEQRAELGARLLMHDPATQTVRNLFRVHDELARGGWAAVETLPSAVLTRALTEAEIMGEQEPSPVLGAIVAELAAILARLAARQSEADARAASEAAAEAERQWAREHPATPEVSETNFDEFEQMERSWVGTVPSGLDPRNPAPP